MKGRQEDQGQKRSGLEAEIRWFQGKSSQAKKCKELQEAGKSKEIDYPIEPQKERSPANSLISGPDFLSQSLW